MAEKEDTNSSTIEEIDSKVEEPSLYQVILLNDHYTGMEFVVLILETIFNKQPAEAEQIMLAVHHLGSGVAGIYIKEIAETKIKEVHNLAAENEFPLRCIMQRA